MCNVKILRFLNFMYSHRDSHGKLDQWNPNISEWKTLYEKQQIHPVWTLGKCSPTIIWSVYQGVFLFYYGSITSKTTSGECFYYQCHKGKSFQLPSNIVQYKMRHGRSFYFTAQLGHIPNVKSLQKCKTWFQWLQRFYSKL